MCIFCAVHGSDIQGNSKRNDVDTREGYFEWDYGFGEPWRSFGTDGTLWKREDYTSESAWRQVDRA